MGQAREVMDRLTRAFFDQDYGTAARLYAPDAVAVTPDQGELKGGDEVVAYMKGFFEAFPDARYAQVSSYEDGNVAVDEGRFVGTNTGAIAMPDGEEIPATGRAIDVRGCDIATVEDGLVTRHHFYFDQMEMLTQLGLAPQ